METHHPIVVVFWDDAFIETEDFSLAKGKKTEPVKRKTVGFLVAETQDGVVLATDEYDKKSHGFAARMYIPHGLITQYWEILDESS